jgi:hypothetical protein
MTRWEYYCFQANTIKMESDRKLYRLGRDGWELVSVVPVELKPVNQEWPGFWYFFKRPLEKD